MYDNNNAYKMQWFYDLAMLSLFRDVVLESRNT